MKKSTLVSIIIAIVAAILFACGAIFAIYKVSADNPVATPSTFITLMYAQAIVLVLFIIFSVALKGNLKGLILVPAVLIYVLSKLYTRTLYAQGYAANTNNLNVLMFLLTILLIAAIVLASLKDYKWAKIMVIVGMTYVAIANFYYLSSFFFAEADRAVKFATLGVVLADITLIAYFFNGLFKANEKAEVKAEVKAEQKVEEPVKEDVAEQKVEEEKPEEKASYEQPKSDDIFEAQDEALKNND